MRRSSLSAVVGTAALTLGAGLGIVGTGTASAAPGSESYIVVLEDGSAAGKVARQHRNRHGAEVSHVFRKALKGYSARLTPVQAAQVRTDSRVDWIQLDGVVHATDRPGTDAAQSLPTGIDRAQADQSPTAAIDGSDQRVDADVAVIDTGIDLDHPDLNVHTTGARNCSTGRKAEDGNGHGTHVAGTIGGLDDGSGVVGMAPGARMWPVRVLDNRGSGSWSDVICGIDYVTANADKIEVANMSLGGAGSDSDSCGAGTDAMHEAICGAVGAGVTFVVAAGNEADDAANHVPAAYDEVITVSALADFNGQPGGGAASTCRVDDDDTFADFSNYGADVDLIAPGVCIESTWKGGGYNTISGTSMASPHVAGAAALHLANNPGASPDAVKSALQTSGTLDWNAGDDPDGSQEQLLDVSTY